MPCYCGSETCPECMGGFTPRVCSIEGHGTWQEITVCGTCYKDMQNRIAELENKIKKFIYYEDNPDKWDDDMDKLGNKIKRLESALDDLFIIFSDNVSFSHLTDEEKEKIARIEIAKKTRDEK